MKKSFKLRIVTPDKDFFQGNVVKLNCETIDGRRGILSNHYNFLSPVVPTITYFEDVEGNTFKVKTSQGMLKVKENHVIILCDSASWYKN